MSEKRELVKIPPNSKEAEMLVLGAMITSINSLNFSCEMLREIDFYFSEHRTIFLVLDTFYRKDAAVDVHLLSEELKRKKQLDEVGGLDYLMTLAQYVGTSVYVEEYVRLIKNKSILRKMISVAQTIEQEAFKEPKAVDEALDLAQQRFFQISQTTGRTLGYTLKELFQGQQNGDSQPFLQALQERQERYCELGPDAIAITGLESGFKTLDRMIDGLVPSNLLIIASRPAMGKTAFALNIASHVACKAEKPVAIFSLEMSAEQLLQRLVCMHAQVESDKIKTGSLSGEEFQRIVSSVHELQEQTIVIEDEPNIKITDLRARARRMKEAHNIGLIIVDYLQLISGSNQGRAYENRQLEISEISRLLKTMAKELSVPVVCLSQLSRRVEERTGHRPMMSDLRESGSIEQDADVVMFLLRREYYDPNDKPGMAEVIVGKNRHGSIGDVPLVWVQQFQLFHNYHPEQQQQEQAASQNEFHQLAERIQ